MEYLKRRIGIVLYEYYCPCCDKFFWTNIPQKELSCPFCDNHSYINGEISIKDMEIDEDEKKENGIPKI